MLNFERETTEAPVGSEAAYGLAPVERAIRRALDAGHGTGAVKAEILSLCRRAKRNGIPVESLVLDVHRMLDRQVSPRSGAPTFERELRQKLVCYVIATYHREVSQ
jgi:hypothetical protein